jgi:hypothetical protein
MAFLFWLLAAACGFAFGTLLIGWWAVPVVGLVAGLALPKRAHPLVATPIAAALGWAALWLRATRAEGFTLLLSRLESLLPVSPLGLFGATLAFPLLTALGAALIGHALSSRPPRAPDLVQE